MISATGTGKPPKSSKTTPAFCSGWNRGGQTAPPNGESGLVFLQRVCKGFETLVQNMMVKGETEVVVCTHAGVITGLLSAYGLPRAQPFEWMCEPGCGYSVRITPSLWMRSMVMEVYEMLPQGEEGEQPDHLMVDIAREAADRAWGKNGENREDQA